jgi:hypothetical protein
MYSYSGENVSLYIRVFNYVLIWRLDQKDLNRRTGKEDNLDTTRDPTLWVISRLVIESSLKPASFKYLPLKNVRLALFKYVQDEYFVFETTSSN